jgi:hypothetical protein
MAASIATAAEALQLLIAATQAASQIATVLQQIQASGATGLTADQWAAIVGNDDSAEAALSAAIAAARSLVPPA